MVMKAIAKNVQFVVFCCFQVDLCQIYASVVFISDVFSLQSQSGLIA